MSFSYILLFFILLFIIRRVRIVLFKFSKKETKLDLHVFTMMMMVEITRSSDKFTNCIRTKKVAGLEGVHLSFRKASFCSHGCCSRAMFDFSLLASTSRGLALGRACWRRFNESPSAILAGRCISQSVV